eukprot:GHUV01014523.1.p1 GENE.GHUV01014523.1~~GHUV01014523.1.p1  ORF type:complete len:522 (+),score=161.40 GHUV01014523.1:61-1626(+)
MLRFELAAGRPYYKTVSTNPKFISHSTSAPRCPLAGRHLIARLQSTMTIALTLGPSPTCWEQPKLCCAAVLSPCPQVAGARHAALFQRFIVALTRGGPGGLPRPIEIHAHDPRRYVADMLAWVHQALCGEREFVVALFGDSSSSRDAATNEAGTRRGTSDDQVTMSSTVLLDRIFESICRPLKVRIEQVLMMNPPLLLCYQLGQLTDFYCSLVVDILGPDAALSQTVGSCRDTANRTFMEQLKAAGDRLLRTPPQPPADLTAPLQVSQSMQLLNEIISAYESSLQHAAPKQQHQQQDSDVEVQQADDGLSSVLSAVLDPLLEMIKRSAEALSPNSPARLDDGTKLDPTAHKVYLINCLSVCQQTLAVRPAAAAPAQQSAELINSHLNSLVGQEAGWLLARSGLAEVVERVRLYQATSKMSGAAAPAAPLAADPSLSHYAVAEALRRFFVAVSSPDALPEFSSIQSPRLRGEAVSRVAASLVDAYEQVYRLLDDPTAGYAELGGSSMVKHTPAQVRTILGVI